MAQPTGESPVRGPRELPQAPDGVLTIPLVAISSWIGLERQEER
jgi:hypothetical protein